MVTALAVVGVLAVLFAAAVVLTRGGAELAPAPRDAADLALPAAPMAPDDVAGIRFGLALRGYRMSEVDDVLERLAAELADRDRRLALLEATVAGGSAPVTSAPAAAPEPVAAPDLAVPAAAPEPSGVHPPLAAPELPGTHPPLAAPEPSAVHPPLATPVEPFSFDEPSDPLPPLGRPGQGSA